MVDSFVAERRLRHVRRIALRRPSLPRVQNLDAIRHRHFYSGLGSRQFEEFASHRSANRLPDELNGIFDDISYHKGAPIIRMMHNYIGDDVCS